MPGPVPPNGRLNEPGEWYLEADRVSPELPPIRIDTDGVDLDLRGHTLRGTFVDRGTDASFGVYANRRAGVRIHDGRIVGWKAGVQASYAAGIVLERLEIADCSCMGANLGGGGAVIRDCVFTDIAGYATEAYAVGLNNPGAGAVIERNIFRNLYRQAAAPAGLTGEGVGVLILSDSPGCIIRDNRFVNDRIEPNTIAIWLAMDGDAVVTGNEIVNFHTGIAGGTVAARIDDNRLRLDGPAKDAIGISGAPGLPANRNRIHGYDNPLANSAGEGNVIT